MFKNSYKCTFKTKWNQINGFFSLTSVKKILYFKTMSGNICEKVANWYLHKKNLTLKIIYKETSKLLEN